MKCAHVVILAVLFTVLAGCASYSGLSDSSRLSGSVPLNSSSALVKVDQAVRLWSMRDGNRDAIEIYEELLDKYQSRDGRFETAVLTAIALHQLEDGRRHEFLMSVERLQEYSDRQRVLPRETEYVLSVHAALTSQPQKMVGNIRMKSAIADLFDTETN